MNQAENSSQRPESESNAHEAGMDQIVFVGTFTLEPLLPAIRFWKTHLAMEFGVKLAPYNQLFQELLDPRSALASNSRGLNVILLRFEDWLRYLTGAGSASTEAARDEGRLSALEQAHLEASFAQLCSALRTYESISAVSTLLVVGPCSPARAADDVFVSLTERFERELSGHVRELRGLELIRALDYHSCYQVVETCDPSRDELGHIPYTDKYYGVLATLCMRRYFSLRGHSFKVIVVDCDNTLWDGVCGEVGAAGVRISEQCRELQRFLMEKSEQGFLVCLCSKNNEADVWKVFSEHPEMVLKREEITATRIDWRPKSENLASLAAALNLGLDSMVFIDDSPIECEEVRAACPNVLTIPWSASDGAGVLRHLWVLDRFRVTEEDKVRKRSYHADAERQRLRESASDLSQFLESLKLEIAIEGLCASNIERAAQLTQRTNQFNCSSVRRSANELRHLMEAGTHQGWTVALRDRFGDYGAVGLMIVRRADHELVVDTFLLSCRALGRGVEHRMLAELGRIARNQQIEQVRLIYSRTPKNEPARLFIQQIGADYIGEAQSLEHIELPLPSRTLEALRYEPTAYVRNPGLGDGHSVVFDSALQEVARAKLSALARIAFDLADIEAISRAVEECQLGRKMLEKQGEGGTGQAVLDIVTDAFCGAFGLEPNGVDPDAELDQYVQHNSLAVVNTTARLQELFNGVETTLLFEHRSLRRISEFIKDKNPKALREVSCNPGSKQAGHGRRPCAPGAIVQPETDKNTEIAAVEHEIAIIGMHGRFPGANSVREFWANLKAGKSSITEVPPERWSVNAYYDQTGKASKTYCKWGGFVQGVDRFDANFFHISPREAETMDPQQRLFLEVVWGLLEDAAYTPERLGKEVGVFVGVIASDYNIYTSQAAVAGACGYRNSDYYQIANRISYFFDFHGPSMAVDTACSSSGAALYLACQSLRLKECTCAVVGGVNLFCHPGRFIQYSQMSLLSRGNSCRPFGDGPHGTLMGEGVGAILIKPLKEALRDGDRIYAIIKGGAMNSGGKTNGFTVPNPLAQADLISRALRNAKVDARSVSYVEAHGTGTALGDPIEVKGLTKAFLESGNGSGSAVPAQYCAIGSVKSNTGHLESAAAIAGVIKVALQLANRWLVPSLHAEVLNPAIAFAETPFFVQRVSSEWNPSALDAMGESTPAPRIAGVSSFGAGGVNTHFILQEYVQPKTETPVEQVPELIVLSAADDAALLRNALELAGVLQSGIGDPSQGASLTDIAFTLQVGRVSMAERLALVVTSNAELADCLLGYCRGGAVSRNVFRGSTRANSNHRTESVRTRPTIGAPGEAETLPDNRARQLERLAELWVWGAPVDWIALYTDAMPRRTHLPSYQFAGDRYWVSQSEAETTADTASVDVVRGLSLLDDGNASSHEKGTYRTIVSRDEFVVRDHVLAQQMVLPGVAYLEMARIAGRALAGSGTSRIRNLVFTQPIIVARDPKEVLVSLHCNRDHLVGEAKSITGAGHATVHASWEMLEGQTQPGPTRVDLEEVRSRCVKSLESDVCYRDFQAMGFSYGPAYQVIRELHYNDEEVISRLVLNEAADYGRSEYELHPALMDGALQTVVAWRAQVKGVTSTLWVPFTMESVEVNGPVTRVAYAVATACDSAANGSMTTFDIAILSPVGETLVRIRKHFIRAYHPSPEPPAKDKPDCTASRQVYYASQWKVMSPELSKPSGFLPRTVLVFALDGDQGDAFRRQAALTLRELRVVCVRPGDSYQEEGGLSYRIKPDREEDYFALVASLMAKDMAPEACVHAWSQDPFVFDEVSLHRQLGYGFYSVLNLCKALIRQQSQHQVRILYCYSNSQRIAQPQYAGIGGMVRSIHRENPNLLFKILELPSLGVSTTDLVDLVWQELQSQSERILEIKYDGACRLVRNLEAFELDQPKNPGSVSQDVKWRTEGVYIITGGVGGLGTILAEHLARRAHGRLVLCGRSPLTTDKERKLEQLRAIGAKATYVEADLSSREGARRLIAAARRSYGRIDGVIHSAGVIKDSLVPNKRQSEVASVLGPKVLGTAFLDHETEHDALDFFVLFSSIAAQVGYWGQSDYAYANRFMDEFAAMRTSLSEIGQRSGKSLSIGWPYWIDGGMRMTAETIGQHERVLGLGGLETRIGLDVFEKGLCSTLSHFSLCVGDPSRIAETLDSDVTRTQSKQSCGSRQEGSSVGYAEMRSRILCDMSQLISGILKIPPTWVEVEKPLGDFGFDSLTFTTLAHSMNQTYAVSLSPAVFYQYQTLESLASYLLENHAQRMSEYYDQEREREQFLGASGTDSVVASGVDTRAEENEGLCAVAHGMHSIGPSPSGVRRETRVPEPIAIVGMSGVFPESRDIDAFWKHLIAGHDLIREIPADRWDWREYYGRPQERSDRTDVKWGGFIPDVDRFDAAFFHISPREASLMDPQQRVLLETVWTCIQDAAWSPSDLSGANVGVFVGVSNNDYNELMVDRGVEIDTFTSTGINNSIIANRISYLLNLRGPSEVIDTACSSSLVCIRHAVECIRSGDCDAAIVGGVNIILRPKFHISFRKAGMLCEDGRCKTFDERANGYVRSEGAAAVMLKALSRAEADRDHIYGVIRGVAENHGGRAQSLTAPNAKAQAEVIAKALRNARISPTTVSYIEAHGTGTHLGDPIEVEGLKQAFASYAPEGRPAATMTRKGYCGLGSVKSNIGHLEAAAGLAGLIKIVLAMKHETIPPTIQFQSLNSYIDLGDSPFFVVSEKTPWERLTDESGQSVPRRAGISSFGFGGTNTHMVVEEYAPARPSRKIGEVGEPRLIVLSAQSEERLRSYAHRIKEFVAPLIESLSVQGEGGADMSARVQSELRSKAASILGVSPSDLDPAETPNDWGMDGYLVARFISDVARSYGVTLSAETVARCPSIHELGDAVVRQQQARHSANGSVETEATSLMDMGYTLQVGRDAMDYRLAIVASSFRELHERLQRFCEGALPTTGVFRGHASPRRGASSGSSLPEPAFDSAMGDPERLELHRLAELWVSGADIEWSRLYRQSTPRRISLPSCPFVRERYWLPEGQGRTESKRGIAGHIPVLHPLIDRNRSTVNGLCFSKVFGADLFLLADHVIGGRKILPAAAYLEMARAAGEIAGQQEITALRNVVWARPVVVNGASREVSVKVTRKSETLEFVVSSVGSEDAPLQHAYGTALNASAKTAAQKPVARNFDIESIRRRCGTEMDKDAFYLRLEMMGIQCGPGFRSIERICWNDQEALAEIKLPGECGGSFQDYKAHPTLIDGALQSMIGLMRPEEIEPGAAYLPFSVSEVELLGPLPKHCIAYATFSGGVTAVVPKSKTRSYDIVLLDEVGEEVLRLKEYTVRLHAENASQSPGLHSTSSVVYYHKEWERAELASERNSAPEAGVLACGAEVTDLVAVWASEPSLHASITRELSAGCRSSGSAPLLLAPRKTCQDKRSSIHDFNPEQPSDIERIVESLIRSDQVPDSVIYQWPLVDGDASSAELRDKLQQVVYPIFLFERELLKRKPRKQIQHLYLFQGDAANSFSHALFAAMSGFARSVHQEYPKFIHTSLEIIESPNTQDKARVAEVVLRELWSGRGGEVRYADGQRLVRRLKACEVVGSGDPSRSKNSATFRRRGTYIVTGAMGGLGQILCRFLAKQFDARLVLAGRSRRSSEQQQIDELRLLGSEVLLVHADISQGEAVADLVRQGKNRFGRIHGVIHCAGIIDDAYLVNKTRAAMEAVLAPKVQGVALLDEHTKDEELELFLMFSSLSGVVGNAGQCDYAFGNCFLDEFARIRERLRAENRRHGRTLSIAWPLWRDGGMQLNDDVKALLSRRWGMAPLDSEVGLQILEKGLWQPREQFTVLQGDPERIGRWVLDMEAASPRSQLPSAPSKTDSLIDNAPAAFQEDLLRCLAELLGIPRSGIGLEDDTANLGLSSIVFVDLANRISRQYGIEVLPSAFFERTTPGGISAFLYEEHREKIDRYYEDRAAQEVPSRLDPSAQGPAELSTFSVRQSSVPLPAEMSREAIAHEPVAVIGMSGVMPQSKDLEEFWRNLEAGKDLVSEMSRTRWNSFGCARAETTRPEVITAKWGGFLDNTDRFDARFFNISRREACLMDPQQRLFLETVWKTVEDAGYRASALSGTRTGVYVGVTNTDYYDVIRDAKADMEVYVTTGIEHSILANRISYFFNWHGPSVPVNTACSSSLVAIHDAVQAIRSGRCEMAIAGGVNLFSSRYYYMTITDGGMLSQDGRCKTFDREANGYVRGEGVGAVLLKPLARALKDRDHIYGVVKGVAVNHGGRVSSLTVPNASAQADLVLQALEDAGIAPDTIGYIETHGTGTVLGDPIEVEGLKRAFSEWFKRRGVPTPQGTRIGIGTVKTNIGHLEAAAGIAGVFKVLLAMKYEKIPQNLHFNQVNPYLRLQGSPFEIVTTNQPWSSRSCETQVPNPRRAAVSSFGFGGTNAQVILEECPAPEEPVSTQPETPGRSVFVLSAKDEPRLKGYAENICQFLGRANARLLDIAYTLQVGRDPMPERLAMVVSTVDELRDKLSAYVRGGHRGDVDGIFVGSAASNAHVHAGSPQVESDWSAEWLAQRWVAGAEVDWSRLYRAQKFAPQRISLPTYPFFGEQYWVSPTKPAEDGDGDGTPEEANGAPRIGVVYFRSEWEDRPMVVAASSAKALDSQAVLVFDTNERVRSAIGARLAAERTCHPTAVLVLPGEEFRRVDDATFVVSPASASDYSSLLRALQKHGRTPTKAIHLWSAKSCSAGLELSQLLEPQLEESLYPVVFLTQAAMAANGGEGIRLVVAYPKCDDYSWLAYGALSGLSRSLRRENPNLLCKTVAVCQAGGSVRWPPPEEFAETLLRECDNDDLDVCYTNGSRRVGKLVEWNPVGGPLRALPLRHLGGERRNAVYLITGGMGGLGLQLARYLTWTKPDATLVLVGRSVSSEKIERGLSALNFGGARAAYLQADVSRPSEVNALIGRIQSQFGGLHGIIHCAGVVRDAYLVKKTRAQIDAVLDAKVRGTINLDDATRDVALDFFVLFSSVAASRGSAGQCDYAYANSFMDSFALQRERSRERHERTGVTVSINWPLWEDGGMTIPAEIQQSLRNDSGTRALPSREGIGALENIMHSEVSSCTVQYGDVGVIRELFEKPNCVRAASTDARQKAMLAANFGALRDATQGYLLEIFSELTQVPAAQIECTAAFEEFGIDSILVNKFNLVADRDFRGLPKTLLYEYRNIKELTEYFLSNHTSRLGELLAVKHSMVALAHPTESVNGGDEPSGRRSEPVPPERTGPLDIAVIGMSGRFPKAADIHQFWENLRSGKDCITEMPETRRKLFGDMGTKWSSLYPWGGFLDHVELFDPEFFNISQREAELTDPQERLFLTTAWAALEDAGYCRSTIGNQLEQGLNETVGVFVGATTNDYSFLRNTAEQDERPGIPRAFPWSIANRVSFFLNLNGPSMPVDTGCSSSLTAMHLACESLRRGECSMAIVGGVNVYSHPNKCLQMRSMRMLSPTGRCHAFGAGGDGFVPGEGVGAVIIRPLRDAIRCNDRIYAVIKASAVNHGGRTSGYTKPNPAAQAKVITSALQSAGINARTISYFEAHGTGTALGDPIEVEGITKAFRLHTHEKQFCPVGSVKSNIGHLEGAAGIAGLIKVILQLTHRELVPSIHADTTNPNINFADSPVYVQRELSPWRARSSVEHGEQKKCPRRASLSSFGAGGANAHLILEEYVPPAGEQRQCSADESAQAPQLAVLSAKNRERLRAYAASMVAFIEAQTSAGSSARGVGSLESIQRDVADHVTQMLGIVDSEVHLDVPLSDFGLDPVSLSRLALRIREQYKVEVDSAALLESGSVEAIAQHVYQNVEGSGSDVRLSDLAYTLQTGREAMEERLAVAVHSIAELAHVLRQFCQGRTSGINLHLGNSKHGKGPSRSLANQEMEESVEKLLTQRRLDELAQLWVDGAPIDWSRMHECGPQRPRRISIPTYPFAERTCWFSLRGEMSQGRPEESGQVRTEALADIRAATTDGSGASAMSELVDREDCLRLRLQQIVGDVLYTDAKSIDQSKAFVELGLDSVLGVELVHRINREFDLSLKTTSLYDHSTVLNLAHYLSTLSVTVVRSGGEVTPTAGIVVKSQLEASQSRLAVASPGAQRTVGVVDSDIAIIGMSARVPGADDIWEFWDNLKHGTCSVGEVPVERWDVQAHFDPNPDAPNKTYCKWGGFIRDIDQFDPLFFGISPTEAALLEPQQRVFLQEAWRALESAGYSAESLSGTRCGVCAGVMSYNEYNPTYMFNATSILAARIAYFLNLKGPSYSVDTGCSSSLLAIHLACQHLTTGESDMMLAGGVTLYLSEKQYIEMSRARMLSPRGRCRAFDDGADGIVPAEGVGLVVLKPLRKALRDRDHIYGVIRASGSNQDGKTNGITAPSVQSQKQLELDVYKKCGINPRTIDYVEAHGTGTQLGDPIEFDALTEAFAEYTRDRQFCSIGSAKSNIGHTGAAAGVVGLIKVLLALEHRQMPPLSQFVRANTHTNFEESPFNVCTTLSDWKATAAHPRRAAVSSFGYSGTNVHLVVEEAGTAAPDLAEGASRSYAVILSAVTEETLERRIADLATWLRRGGMKQPIRDIAYTLAVGRTHFSVRWAAVVGSTEELLQRIGAAQAGARATREQLLGNDEKECNAALWARRYLDGGNSDWRELFEGEPCRRISMPTYPFLRNRYWLSNPKAEATTQSSEHTLTDEQLRNATIAFLRDVLSKHDALMETKPVSRPHKVLRGNNAAARR